jgi:hypothetical protein
MSHPECPEEEPRLYFLLSVMRRFDQLYGEEGQEILRHIAEVEDPAEREAMIRALMHPRRPQETAAVEPQVPATE